MKRYLPQSLSSQFILLLVCALVISQVLNVIFLMGERRYQDRSTHYNTVIERIVTEALKIEDVDPSDLPIVISESRSFQGSMFLSENNRADVIPRARQQSKYRRVLERRLSNAGVSSSSVTVVSHSIAEGRPPPPPPGRVRRPPPIQHPSGPPSRGGRPALGFEEAVFSVELEPGVWLNTLAPHYSTETLTTRAIATTGLTMLAAILAAIFWARRIVRPIRELGDAASSLGRGEAAAPISETGPQDIRAATRAFNTMQERLTRIIEEQRSTLRAVGHDLRTPLTSLRIRAEDLPEEHGRSKFIASLDDLATMTDEILAWSRDTAAVEDLVWIDLTSLLDSISQDYADLGKPVTFTDPERVFATSCRRVALRRAIANIVDNALKYAGDAHVSISAEDDYFHIYIDDNGPGIPHHLLPEVTTPFRRLETSRNRETGGIGLGLSIAQSIVQSHGGLLIISNRPQAGLRVTISLPRA